MLGKLIANILTFGAADSISTDLRDAANTWGIARAGTGARVNGDTALTVSAWFRAIDLLGDCAAKATCNVYSTVQGAEEVDAAHPWNRALFRKAGTNQTAFQFFKTMVSRLRSDGNAYAYIDRVNNELLLIDNGRIVPVIEGAGAAAKLWYVLDQKRKYDPDEIIHLKGFSFDGITGLSVVDKAREALGLSIGARTHQARTLRNSARPSVLLTMPGKMPKPQKDAFLAEWHAMHQGGDAAGRTAILDGDMKAAPYTFSSQDMELMESQRFTVRDIANFTGVPAHKLGDTSRAGYNSIEAENLAFLGDTLEAMLVGIEHELEDKLLTEAEKDSQTHQIIFDRKKLSGTDTATKATYWRTALGGHPWQTPAEARRAFSMPYMDGTDFIPEPANMGGGGESNRPKDATGDFPKGALQEATAASLQAAAQRLFRKLGHQARAAIKKPDTFAAWVASIEADAAEFAPLEAAAGLAHGVDLAGKVGAQCVTHAQHLLGKCVTLAEVEAACREFETIHIDTKG